MTIDEPDAEENDLRLAWARAGAVTFARGEGICFAGDRVRVYRHRGRRVSRRADLHLQANLPTMAANSNWSPKSATTPSCGIATTLPQRHGAI